MKSPGFNSEAMNRFVDPRVILPSAFEARIGRARAFSAIHFSVRVLRPMLMNSIPHVPPNSLMFHKLYGGSHA